MKIKKLCLIMVLVMLALVFAACKFEVDTSELEVKCEYDVISIGEINPLEIKSTNAYEIKSSDESIATIEDDNVIGKAEGKVTITVTSKNLKAEVEITVIDASISLKNNSIEVKPNQEVDLNEYFSCNLSTNITYSVSDTTILNLQNGKVTALKEGSTYVFASYKQNNTTLSKTLEITVLEDIDIESEDYDEAVYLGIFNYGAVTSLEMDNFVYRFFIKSGIRLLQ